jgi:hypothetical protein
VLVLRRGGELGWVFSCSLGGESWDGEEEGEEEGEIEEESVGRVCIYWRLPMNHRQTFFVGIPVGESAVDYATSLYGDPGLNSLVIPSVKLSEKNPHYHTVELFKKPI